MLHFTHVCYSFVVYEMNFMWNQMVAFLLIISLVFSSTS